MDNVRNIDIQIKKARLDTILIDLGESDNGLPRICCTIELLTGRDKVISQFSMSTRAYTNEENKLKALDPRIYELIGELTSLLAPAVAQKANAIDSLITEETEIPT